MSLILVFIAETNLVVMQLKYISSSCH